MTIEIPYRDCPMHVYMPGKTRQGKSTLVFWMALEDIKNGQGVTVMDAKEDLIHNLLKAIPTKYRDKTIYLDLNHPVPIDIMRAETHEEKEHLVDQLKDIITRGMGTEGAYTVDKHLTDLIYTLLDYNNNPDPEIKPERRACFLDIFWFLENESRRKEITKGLRSERYIQLWKQPIPRADFNAQQIGRITGRMNPWVSSPRLLAVFGAPSPPLNIDDAYANQNIILAKLGEDEINSIWGTILISKIRQAAIRQKRFLQPDRTAHFLYCDEFQNFQTKDFNRLLSMAGGYGLCLTLANQYVGQLDGGILDAIIGTVSTFVLFRLGSPSARTFSDEIPSMETELAWKRSPLSGQMEWMTRPLPFDPAILTRLPEFKVLFRRADGTVSYESVKKWPIFSSDGNAEYIKKRTEKTYGREPLKLLYNEGNVRSNSTNVTKGDDIEAEPETQVKAHAKKKRSPKPSK